MQKLLLASSTFLMIGLGVAQARTYDIPVAASLGLDNSASAANNGGKSLSDVGNSTWNAKDSYDTVALGLGGAAVGNGELTVTSSFNQSDLDVTVATSHAGGSLDGYVGNSSDHAEEDYKGASNIGNHVDGNVGVISAGFNTGLQQMNTSVAAVGFNASASAGTN